MQAFLLETSILDNLRGPLCDALTGRDDGQETLERLERENLFVVALDDERRWYRYHRLFADFLRGRLTRESPSAWRIAPQGLRVERAERLGILRIKHALSAGDHERAARLMESGVGQTWYRGEVVTLLGWLQKLPGEAMRDRPLLLVWYAAALMLAGQLDGVESLLEKPTVRSAKPRRGAATRRGRSLASAGNRRGRPIHARPLSEETRRAPSSTPGGPSLSCPKTTWTRVPSPPSPWRRPTRRPATSRRLSRPSPRRGLWARPPATIT